MNAIRWNPLLDKKPVLLFVVSTVDYFRSHRLPLARAAQTAGYEVVVATTFTSLPESLSTQFHFIPLKYLQRTGMNPLQDLRLIKELKALYKRLKPDIIHHIAVKPVLYGSIAAKLSRMPIVVNALTGLGFLFISHKWWVRLIRFCIMRLLKWSWHSSSPTCKTHLIVQNPDDYQIFEPLTSKNNISIIQGSGVNPHIFTPPLTKVINSPCKVVMVSRLLKDKGILELIEASRILQQQKIDISLELYGAPDPLNPTSVTIEDIRTWEQERLCVWKGATNTVVLVYQQADVAVLPSYREGLPKSLLEAAACGLPIITTDVPGCREIVKDNINGILVPLKDPVALAAAIKTLVLDQHLRTRYGQESRQIVLTHFQESIICTQTIDLYKKLLTSV